MSRGTDSRKPDSARAAQQTLLGRLVGTLRRGRSEPSGSLPEILRRTGLFRRLDSEAFAELCASVRVVCHGACDRIIEEGQLASDLFVVRTGSIRIITAGRDGKPVVLRRLEAGDYFGEQALLEDAPGHRSASAVAVGDVELLVVSHEAFKAVLQSSRKLAEALRSDGRRQLVETWMKRREIFGAVDAKLVEQLSRQVRQFAAGELIFSQGDVGDGAYLITDGEVQIRLAGADGEPVRESRRGSGQIIGEVALLAGGRRTGTARARGPVRALFLDRKRFLALHAANPLFQRHLREVEHVYRMPYRGLVSIGSGEYEGMDCVTSIFQLADGRSVIASRVRGQDIFVMSETGALEAESWTYANDEIRREIGLSEGRIVSVSSFGAWPELADACSLLLEARQVERWREALFRGNGVLQVERPAVELGLLCHCMKVARHEIRGAIAAGCTELEAVSAATGAGTVCGSCRGDIAEMLGNASWVPVALDRAIRWSEGVRSYRLRPFEGGIVGHEPGQYIVLQSLIDGNFVSRSYTLTSVPSDADGYEITVKREENGFFSRWLFEHDASRPFLRVAPPRGEGIHTLLESGPLVCLVAGIGVTPVVALARFLGEAGSGQRLHVDYSARTRADLVFGEELERICAALPGMSLRLRLTSERGRISAGELGILAREYDGAGFFLCGPEGFAAAASLALQEAGVPRERIVTEQFIPAGGRL